MPQKPKHPPAVPAPDIVIDMVQEYGPELPPPDDPRWKRVRPVDDILEMQSAEHPSALSLLRRELAGFLGRELGGPLYIAEADPAEQELAAPIAFARYLKEVRILKTLSRRPNPTDIPQLVKFSAYTEEEGPAPTDGLGPTSHYAHGSSLSALRSLWKAVGECAERYSATRYRKREFVLTAFEKLGIKKAIDPLRTTAFSSEERRRDRRRQVTPQSVFAWAQATNIVSGRTLLAPAQLFYYNYRFLDDEPYLRQPISTGSAGAFALPEAIYAGLCEAVERDAYMIAYMNRLSLPRYDPQSIKQPDLRELIEAFQRYRLRLELVDATTDIKIPTILALVVDELSDRGPAVSIGAKADTDILWAMRGAIEEAWHGLGSTRWAAEYHRDHLFRRWKYAEVVNPDDRMWFWARPRMRRHIAFWLSGPLKKFRGGREFTPRHPDRQLEMAVDALTRAGLTDILYRDLTIPALASQGFRVVATLVPELTHMFLDEGQRATGGPRLISAPRAMGYQPARFFNPVPHPFA